MLRKEQGHKSVICHEPCRKLWKQLCVADPGKLCLNLCLRLHISRNMQSLSYDISQGYDNKLTPLPLMHVFRRFLAQGPFPGFSLKPHSISVIQARTFPLQSGR